VSATSLNRSLSQPTVSHHLKVLRDAGLITREKRGVWAYYRIVPAALEGLSDRSAASQKPDNPKATWEQLHRHLDGADWKQTQRFKVDL
jgi:DNA-binding transcriptional ArsR family regulator